MVDDPYPDDYDPDAWQKFFSQFGWVTFVTIAFDNGELLKVSSVALRDGEEFSMIEGTIQPSPRAGSNWIHRTDAASCVGPAEPVQASRRRWLYP